MEAKFIQTQYLGNRSKLGKSRLKISTHLKIRRQEPNNT